MPAPAAPPPARAPIVPRLGEIERAETRTGVYYWHTLHGARFCHFYDPVGIHWYGWWHGPHFYWTRFHLGYWWWRDPFFGWSYWDDGRWWRGPSLGEALPVSPPPPTGGSWTSPDRSRMVQVSGPGRDAFLYDNSGATPRFMKHLGTAVEGVRFSGGLQGQRLLILLDLAGGRFELMDADGRRLEDLPPPAARENAPAPPPDAAPPPSPPPQ